MKKLLLFLMAFVSLSTTAAVEKTITFDFKDIYNLSFTPAITSVPEGYGDVMNITGYKVEESPVSLTFNNGTGFLGAAINRAGSTFSVTLRSMCELVFQVSGGCQLTKIQFYGTNTIVNGTNSPGRFDSNDNHWIANGEKNVTKVVLTNGLSDSRVSKVSISYLSPATPLTFVSSNPLEGSAVNSFKSMKLQFNTSVTKVNTGNISLTGSAFTGTKTMTASPSGSTVDVSLPEALSTEGSFTVHVPAGIFETSEGATNDPIEVSFQIIPKRDTFVPTVEPASGTVTSLPQTVTLTFPNYVKLGTGTVKFKRSDNSGSFSAAVAVNTANQKQVLITHDHNEVEAATWTVEIPEKLFHTDFPETDADYIWNPAQTLTYTVDGSQYNPGPQDSETMKAAKELLQQTGVGYPKTSTDEYKALYNLVNADETPSDESLTVAMTALYNSTDITMPEVDKWYKIAGINNLGQKIYLTFSSDKTKVVLGTIESNAAAFKVKEINDGKVVFVTKEGFYLHVLTTLPMHVGTSDTNLTDAESDINKLTIAKFNANSVEGADAKSLYGTFTIYGSLGKVNGNEEFAYALLNFDNTSISTYAGTPLTFNASMSNAFILSETTEPTDVMDYVYLSVGMRPDNIDKAGDEMLLIIHGPTGTTIKDASKIYFMKGDEKVSFTGNILTLTSTANTYAVNTTGLEPGIYKIVMEVGAFNFDVPAGKTVKEISLDANITIRGESTPTPPTPSVTAVTPSAKLAPAAAIKAGDELVLSINNVKKATLTTSAKPVYKYADGTNSGKAVSFSGTILTKKSDLDFNVNTEGLAAGKYTLTLPVGTFTYEVEEGKTANDVEMTVAFEIKEEEQASEDFKYIYDAYILYFPASKYRSGQYYKDVDLNQLYLYVYDYMYSGMVANPDKKVTVVTMNGGVAMTGHFENYPNFAKENEEYSGQFAGTYAIKFVPDNPLEEGDLNGWPGSYTYRCEPGCFGDANYGKWLKNNKSVSPSECRVSPLLNVGNILVYNSRVPTGIDTITTNDAEQVIYDLQGRRVTTPDKKGIYIINGKKTVIK